ncbi:GNAT family N-acetyltransferase [Sphingomonas sp. AR_OL41]|jgi:RimJ/RimL family protein N-acetyltransferase|uniref:GNAT family N-acetyltransferase n=1 Tax=Sphingomonas sp. AR_OL41 TaxID=3042729 RepID=UPI002481619C|nr:GNAT family N-acetyltransferase [Sphingomonas sp. AR_OL41]MDH7971341.1 GNAT family N-acetyltransferase [Sphingomonas sp. AR_OL41]
MFARTARLTLRPAWVEDAPQLAAAIGHESVARNLSKVPWPYGVADAEAFLTRPRAPHDIFCLILTHDGDYPQLIGGIGMAKIEDGHEFGYWLTPNAWGRGYATEAGRAMVSTARHTLGLRRLKAGHFVDNPASGRVLTKLGFRPTGRIAPREALARGGETPCADFVFDLDDGDCRMDRLAA